MGAAAHARFSLISCHSVIGELIDINVNTMIREKSLESRKPPGPYLEPQGNLVVYTQVVAEPCVGCRANQVAHITGMTKPGKHVKAFFKPFIPT